MARAPQAILQAQAAIVGGVGGAVASGIVGDAAHSYGYHRARTEIASNDYSAVLPLDREGPGDAASALDISLPPERMIEITARLRAAAGRNDPRLYALREFAGTLDGRTTFNRDLSTSIEGFAQWDDSHLWHIHLSGYRAYADDGAAWAAIVSVFTDSAVLGGALSEEDDMNDEQWATIQESNSMLKQLLFYAQEGPPPCKLYGDQEGGGIYLAAPGFWWHVPNPGYVALLQRYRLAGAVINVDHANEVGFFEGVFKGQAGNADVIAKLDELAATWHPLDPDASIASAEEIVKQLGEAITKGATA